MTTFTPELEACARALCFFNEQLPWEEIDEDGEQYYREAARACVLALIPVSDAVKTELVSRTSILTAFEAAIRAIAAGGE